jgi:hypothetical protein
VEMLRVNVFSLVRRDLAELKSAENLTIVNLKWKWGSSIESVLPVLERSRYLRRLTFHSCAKISVPPFQVLSNFIIQMKLLTQLQIALKIDISNDDQLKILRDKVNELILPQRPNFQFDISHSDDCTINSYNQSRK